MIETYIRGGSKDQALGRKTAAIGRWARLVAAGPKASLADTVPLHFQEVAKCTEGGIVAFGDEQDKANKKATEATQSGDIVIPDRLLVPGKDDDKGELDVRAQQIRSLLDEAARKEREADKSLFVVASEEDDDEDTSDEDRAALRNVMAEGEGGG